MHLRDAVRNEVEDVETRDALGREQLRGVALVLLQHRGENVARVGFVALRALHVEDGRLQHAPESHRLFRVFGSASPLSFDRVVQVLIQIATQFRQIGAARRENPLAVWIVRQGVEQVFEREIRVSSRNRLAERDVQDDFQRR